MLLAASIGCFAYILYASFRTSWRLGCAALVGVVIYYWWRFSILIRYENDPAYDCNFILVCTNI